MKQAVVDEQHRKAAGIQAADTGRKRALEPSPEDLESHKKPKLEHSSQVLDTTSLLNFDFSTLPPSLLTDIVIANLQMISEENLQAAIQVWALA